MKFKPKSYRTHSGNVSKIQKHTYPENWRQICAEKKAEVGNKCQRCPSTKELDVHHIIPLSRGGNNLKTNLIVLCHTCHKKRHHNNRFMK